ncbi:MAG TPA: hypothetical protein VFH73_01935, partial [Polyangia bacterium]|nr:hypothetical protein [Polyangia bacterium]
MSASRPREEVTLGSGWLAFLALACVASVGFGASCAKTRPIAPGNADGGGVDGAAGGANGGGNGGGSSGSAGAGVGGNSGNGGMGVITDPPPGDCAPDGTCPTGFLCTSSNKCGKIGKPCSNPNDCQGDTFCCGAGCRKDGMADGVCLPGNVPPGIACKG